MEHLFLSSRMAHGEPLSNVVKLVPRDQMYCPTCGLEHQEVRRFCNRCGTNLETVSRALAGNVPDSLTAQKLERRQQAMRRAFLVFGSGPVWGFSLLILAEILREAMPPVQHPFYGYLTDPPPVHIVETLALFGPLLMLVGVMMLIYVRVVYGRKKESPPSEQPLPPLPEVWPQPVQKSGQTTAIPPPASVTENTTFRLEAREMEPQVVQRSSETEEVRESRQSAQEHS